MSLKFEAEKARIKATAIMSETRDGPFRLAANLMRPVTVAVKMRTSPLQKSLRPAPSVNQTACFFCIVPEKFNLQSWY